MKNQAYWQQRFAELEYANNQTAQKVFKAEMVRAFDKAMAELDKEIAAWLLRFALNNGVLSITEARKLLNAAELKELKWDVEEYVAKGRENAFTAAWVKELENASAKFHISRLEALKLHIRQYLETAFGTEHKVLTETMNSIYENTYYHTCFEVQHGFNIGWNIGQVDERRLDKVVNSPWAPDGRNFSDRIWTAKEKMVNELQQQITQDLLLGRAPDEAINAMTQFLKDKTHNAKVNAGRLVMTEEVFVASAAQRDAFKDLGVEEYEIVATLDSHTSAICQEMDGKHFPMKDYQPGTTAPPFHVYCRSVTAPYFDDEWSHDGQRAARDSDDGKTYYVPEDMTYQEWKEKYASNKAESLPDDEQYYRPVDRGESTTAALKGENIKVSRVTSYSDEVYISDNAHIKPKALHEINKNTNDALNAWGIPADRKPKIVIVSEDELSGAYGMYDAVNDTIYYTPNITKSAADFGNTEYHETWHVKQAEDFRNKGWNITAENKFEYIKELSKQAEKRVAKLGVTKYNVSDISGYAKEMYQRGRFDEVEAEYMMMNRKK